MRSECDEYTEVHKHSTTVGCLAFAQSENTHNVTRVTLIATSQSEYYGFVQSPKIVFIWFTSAVEYLSLSTMQTEHFALANDRIKC
jgi:hypothetical protein